MKSSIAVICVGVLWFGLVGTTFGQYHDDGIPGSPQDNPQGYQNITTQDSDDRRDMRASYKLKFKTRLGNKLDSIDDARLGRISSKISDMTGDVTTSRVLSDTKKSKLLSQLEALQELIDEALENDTSATYDVATSDVTISGGHEVDGGPGGRPVTLIGPALGITGDQFAAAFSGVTPEDNGHLNEQTAQANKAILLAALSPYNITNDRLDTVTDYYRYKGSDGDFWPTQTANIQVIIENGSVTGFNIINGGSGYSGAPTITVRGHNINTQVILHFSTDLRINGSISEIRILD